MNLLLNEFATQVFTKIHLAERYSKLCDLFSDFDGRLSRVDRKEIIKLLRPYMYSFKYIDNSYYFIENFNEVTFHIKLKVKGGTTHIVFNVEESGEFYDFRGGDIARIHYLLLDLERGRLVCFTNYQELGIILKEYLEIYEDFKKEIIKQLG